MVIHMVSILRGGSGDVCSTHNFALHQRYQIGRSERLYTKASPQCLALSLVGLSD